MTLPALQNLNFDSFFDDLLLKSEKLHAALDWEVMFLTELLYLETSLSVNTTSISVNIATMLFVNILSILKPNSFRNKGIIGKATSPNWKK